MLHRIEQPTTPEFRGLIEKFWLLPRKGRSGLHTFEAPPDGNFALVFILAESGCKALYVGPFTRLRHIPLLNNCDYFCVLFHPGIMPCLIDAAAGDLVNTWAEVPKVLGTAVDELGEQLSAALELGAKRRLMEDFFRKAGLASVIPQGMYFRAAGLVAAARGRIRVAGLADTLGVTTRTLERMFLEQTGMPPKMFIRLVRFQNVLSQLRSGRSNLNLASLASEWGYADQSHFIRDFKALMHVSPGAL